MQKPLKIGIVGLREIGSTMMLWPLLWNIDSAIERHRKEVGRGIIVDYIVMEDRGHSNILGNLRNVRLRVFSTASLLKVFEYDLIVSPFPFQPLKSRIFSRIKSRTLLSPETQGLGFNRKDANLKLHNYYLKYLDPILKSVGVAGYSKTETPKFSPQASEDVLAKFGLQKNNYVIFSPASDSIISSWSSEVFRYFLSTSKKDDSLPVVVVGTRRFISYPKSVKDLTGKTSLSELISLLWFSKKNYTTETATLHLSSHMRKPTVAALSAITPWFLTDDMKNVRAFSNKNICPEYPCHTKFPLSECPKKKRYCLTNAFPSLEEAAAIKKELWKK